MKRNPKEDPSPGTLLLPFIQKPFTFPRLYLEARRVPLWLLSGLAEGKRNWVVMLGMAGEPVILVLGKQAGGSEVEG